MILQKIHIRGRLGNPYGRERFSSLEGNVWCLLSFPDSEPSVESYIRPHGRLLIDGKIIYWGHSRDSKLILMEAFERSHIHPESEAFGAVLMKSGMTVDEYQHEPVREVVSRLGIQNLV